MIEMCEKCEYCEEIIIEEDSCEGSLYNGVKLCVDCLADWQGDNNCHCESCDDYGHVEYDYQDEEWQQ